MSARCSICHNGPALTDNKFHNVAVAQIGPGQGDGTGRDDFGRMRETGNPADRYAFRTPPLRNVELTAPYGHDGAIVDLRAFIDHYSESDIKLRTFDVMQLEDILRPSAAADGGGDPRDARHAAQWGGLPAPGGGRGDRIHEGAHRSRPCATSADDPASCAERAAGRPTLVLRLPGQPTRAPDFRGARSRRYMFRRMTPGQLVQHRLRNQRIAATTFTDPADVVRWHGAVQAQDYLGALWALGLRTRDATERSVEQASRAGRSSGPGPCAARCTSWPRRTCAGCSRCWHRGWWRQPPR